MRSCLGLGAAVLLLSACETMSTWFPQFSGIPPPWQWFSFGSSKKLPPLPAFDAKTTPRVNWQVALGGKEVNGFTPVVGKDAVVAAGPDGSILSVDASTGKQHWGIRAGRTLSAGVGAASDLVVVGTDKADVLAFDAAGKPLWQTKISSEVAGPPLVAEGLAVAWSLDGKIFGLNGADGRAKWVYQRTNPPLTVRRVAGGVVSRGGLFTGTAGGRLLALDLSTGALGWEASVATPKGATELERIADVTSLPVVEERQVCAAAYQGRVACFEIVRGTLVWSRDFSSLSGITVDNRYLFLTDDKGAIHALDKATGASVWKQDKLVGRLPSGPALIGDYLGVVDGEGYLHLLDRNDGALIGRVATDGAAAESQPAASGAAAIWQSAAGNLISASARYGRRAELPPWQAPAAHAGG
jgi:outer membrane protein assembly factor BamB